MHTHLLVFSLINIIYSYLHVFVNLNNVCWFVALHLFIYASVSSHPCVRGFQAVYGLLATCHMSRGKQKFPLCGAVSSVIPGFLFKYSCCCLVSRGCRSWFWSGDCCCLVVGWWCAAWDCKQCYLLIPVAAQKL